VREVLFSVGDCSEPDCRTTRLMPRGRLLEYCVDSRHLAAHRAITSSSRATFKFRLFLGLPRIVSRIGHSIYWSIIAEVSKERFVLIFREEQEVFLALLFHSAKRHISKTAISFFVYYSGKIRIEFKLRC
jgi:hypothetical protein